VKRRILIIKSYKLTKSQQIHKIQILKRKTLIRVNLSKFVVFLVNIQEQIYSCFKIL